MAFNAKNLEYNKQEPAFLRRLKGEVGGVDGRHNVQIPRPKKDRLKTGDDDEDEPMILDERGERVERAEFERMVKGEDDAQKSTEGEEAGGTGSQVEGSKGSEPLERQKVTEIGSAANAKKRKVGKVVGGEDEDGEDVEDRALKQKDGSKEKAEKPPAAKVGPSAPKKKGKKIKLSFDDPDG
ncbi:uncharacterized protein Z520_00722 [Fonsecaea multimorphosa CBS 102226]|uniref:DUF4604 domain-containing protein n=1 Tax=Fonsecaea multimorphosa CBS 102226 TaxID=1442371 RepID=A0A0D2KKM3_9EURO|nr:uncharacterized protein Z520_00722 [Fonsecaea multimorphosa CBS 102226]KIY04030.1 hypothetical protein Z520_00722 [Fonsecaea multimorphosa CBS 102226]OAL31866.1 hypothetical protein AYO22_00736 [Fonsecaea multimorphosa]